MLTPSLVLASGTGEEEPLLEGELSGTDAATAVVIFGVSIMVAVLLRRLLVRALDRGDADRHVGRLTGRFLSLVVVTVGAVYAFGEAGVRVGPLLGGSRPTTGSPCTCRTPKRSSSPSSTTSARRSAARRARRCGWRVRDAVAVAIKEHLDDAGIAIPFPQRTLWLGSSEDA